MVQAASAALATYLLCLALGVKDYSWAIISALLVAGASVGSNLRNAVTRVLGAMAGLAIALACIFTIGIGFPQTIISLGTAVAVMSVIAGFRPELKYGLVTVAILILAPGGDVVETAWTKAAAISLGTVVGALAGTFILPLPAHRRAEEHLGRALHRCGDLLAAGIHTLTGRGPEDLRPIHRDIRAELASAQAMAEQSQAKRLHPKGHRPEPQALVDAVQRLWHSLVILDQVDEHVLSDGPRKLMDGALQDAMQATSQYLVELGDAVAANSRPGSPETVRKHIAEVTRALEDVRRTGATDALDDDDTERVFALSLAFKQTQRNITEIAQLMGSDDLGSD